MPRLEQDNIWRCLMIENFIDRFVPSKDEREFLKDKSVTFSDVEQAEIIINHECLKNSEKKQAVQELKETISDKELITEKVSSAQGEVIVLNKADFLSKVYNYEKNQTQWVYEGNKPAIIDFYADWCGPCKKVSPILKELAAQYKDDIVIYKINVDNEKELASAFGIQSIPTLLFIPKTGKPQIAQGALSKEQFVEQIDNFLLKK